MIENWKKFEQAIRDDKELAQRYEEELKRIATEKSAGSDDEGFAKAAQALGFDVTVSDIEKARAETQELDPEELDKAAGGWCWGSYDCYTAWHHDTPDEDGTACFKDHECLLIYRDVLEDDPNERKSDHAK